MYSSSEEDEDLAVLLLALATRTDKKIKKKKKWILEWRKSRSQRSSYNFLMEDLKLKDKRNFKNYLRMDEHCFEEIFKLIENDISRKDTILRTAIPGREKLAVVLRFLATGESIQSLNFQSKISRATISNAIKEICEAIFRRMQHIYLKVRAKLILFNYNAYMWISITLPDKL